MGGRSGARKSSSRAASPLPLDGREHGHPPQGLRRDTDPWGSQASFTKDSPVNGVNSMLLPLPVDKKEKKQKKEKKEKKEKKHRRQSGSRSGTFESDDLLESSMGSGFESFASDLPMERSRHDPPSLLGGDDSASLSFERVDKKEKKRKDAKKKSHVEDKLDSDLRPLGVAVGSGRAALASLRNLGGDSVVPGRGSKVQPPVASASRRPADASAVQRFFLSFNPPVLAVEWSLESQRGAAAVAKASVTRIALSGNDLADPGSLAQQLLKEYTFLKRSHIGQVSRLLKRLAAGTLPSYRIVAPRGASVVQHVASGAPAPSLGPAAAGLPKGAVTAVRGRVRTAGGGWWLNLAAQRGYVEEKTGQKVVAEICD